MSYCPNCGHEYRSDVELCADCGAELVDKHPNDRSNAVPELRDFELLTTADSLYEADRIEALLNSLDIPVLRKHRAGGSATVVIMGASSFGVDLLVPQSMLALALEALGPAPDTEEEVGEYDDWELEEDAEDWQRRSQTAAWTTLVGLPPKLSAFLLALAAVLFFLMMLRR